ncbi:MAG: adenosylcobinamide-GDP ribazoletransferase [Actinomycetes bacterium]
MATRADDGRRPGPDGGPGRGDVVSLGEGARLLAFATGFLTRLPVPRTEVRDGDLRRASALFPFVGLLVAAVGVAAWAAVEPFWGAVVATVVAVGVEVAVTGAFHEDGLADVFDGVWGGWTPQRRIEIMRDSRLGTYGTAALVGALSLRVAMLVPLDLAWFARATVLGHVVGRASIPVMVRLLPAASDQGHGARVSEPLGWLGTSVAALTTAGTLVVCLGTLAWVPLVAAALPVAATRRLYRRRLDGLTGDCLGATVALVQLAVIAAVTLVAS